MGVLGRFLKTLAVPGVRHLQNNVPIEVLFQKHQVMPDALHDPPHKICDVLWNRSRARACMGNIVEPWRLLDQPCVQWISEPGRFYTIVMLNIDMPHRSKPSMRHFVHWMVGNIPGGHIDDGHSMAEYVGPAPPENSGLHRIAFLVYGQPGDINFDEKCLTKKMGKQRANFKLDAFVKKHSLFGPLGMNYIMVEYESEVKDLLLMMGLTDLIPKKKKKHDTF